MVNDNFSSEINITNIDAVSFENNDFSSSSVNNLMSSVLFLGTSHISSDSVNSIKGTFLDFKPDIVAVELDKGRLHSLLSGYKPSFSLANVRYIGVKGYLFAFFGSLLQKKLGKLVGMDPGSDMLQGSLLAKNNGVPLLLLDQDIAVTLRNLSKAITFKEKLRFISDILFGWAKKKQPKVSINLSKVPSDELIIKLISILKGRYPSLYKVLLSDRNIFMANRLAAAVLSNPEKKFLVIVGAGHLVGLKEEFSHALTSLSKKI